MVERCEVGQIPFAISEISLGCQALGFIGEDWLRMIAGEKSCIRNIELFGSRIFLHHRQRDNLIGYVCEIEFKPPPPAWKHKEESKVHEIASVTLPLVE